MNKIFIPLVSLLFLAGCMVDAESIPNEGLETKSYENSQRIVQSYQFWNDSPMSVANATVFNQTGELECELRSFNHDVGNLTIIIENEEEILFNQTYTNETALFSISVSANMTMTSYASGFHNYDVNPIGDYFAVYCDLLY